MTTDASDTLAIAAEQARKVRALYPELYAFLVARDRELRRAIGALPPPMDEEGWISASVRVLIAEIQRTTPPGLNDLANLRQ